MKRRDLLRHLEMNGCVMKREGGKHSIWWRPDTGARTPLPRHNEVKETTAREICKQLEIPEPTKGK